MFWLTPELGPSRRGGPIPTDQVLVFLQLVSVEVWP